MRRDRRNTRRAAREAQVATEEAHTQAKRAWAAQQASHHHVSHVTHHYHHQSQVRNLEVRTEYRRVTAEAVRKKTQAAKVAYEEADKEEKRSHFAMQAIHQSETKKTARAVAHYEAKAQRAIELRARLHDLQKDVKISVHQWKTTKKKFHKAVSFRTVYHHMMKSARYIKHREFVLKNAARAAERLFYVKQKEAFLGISSLDEKSKKFMAAKL